MSSTPRPPGHFRPLPTEYRPYDVAYRYREAAASLETSGRRALSAAVFGAGGALRAAASALAAAAEVIDAALDRTLRSTRERDEAGVQLRQRLNALAGFLPSQREDADAYAAAWRTLVASGTLVVRPAVPVSQGAVHPPEPQRQDVDAVAAAARRGAHEASGAAYERLTAWCDADADASGLFEGWGNEFSAVRPDAEVERWTDDEIVDAVDADWVPAAVREQVRACEGPLTDAARVAFVRARLEAVVDGGLGEHAVDYPHFGAVRLRGTRAGAVSLCFDVSSFDRAGTGVTWVGAYEDLTEWRDLCRSQGMVTSPRDVAALSDAALVALWRGVHRPPRP